MADGLGRIVWGDETEIASLLAPALYLIQGLLGAVLINKQPCPERPLGAAAGLRSKVRSWWCAFTFAHDSAIRFLINLEAWHLLEGVRLQRRATSPLPTVAT